MKRNLTLSLALILALTPVTTLISCSDDEIVSQETEKNPFLNVQTENSNFEADAGEKSITVKSNVDWTATVAPDGEAWCTAQKVEKDLKIIVKANDQKGIRQTMVKVVAGNVTKEIKVQQLGWAKAILIAPESVKLPASGEDFKLEVTSNMEYAITIENQEWIKRKPVSRADEHPMVTSSEVFTALGNKHDEQRTNVISVKPADEAVGFEPVICSVIQDGLGEYKPEKPETIKDDIKVKIIGGKASSFYSGEDIEKSFDGDMTTIYHSDWNNQAPNYFPITLEYQFAKGSDMDYFVYYPRTSGGRNGLFKEVEIEVKTNANSRATDEWQKVMTYDFKGSNAATRVAFPKSLIGVSAIKFIVKSGAGDGKGFASCAEMEFYSKNPESFDYSTLFTDATCSALKPGVTEADISRCTHSFYKNIAYFMLIGKYSKEFRVNTFKAYPHPNDQAAINKTNAYSLLDNPTGIAVDKDETLIVLADDLKNQNLSIRVQNLDKPGGDGFGGDTYPLASGVNKLKIRNKGLVYVMYHTPDYESAVPVKLHFASGKVNGYFDLNNPAHKGKGNELLNKAVDKYFDVLGEYTHLTFPVSRFKNHTKNIEKLIETWDRIAYREQEFMGGFKYGRNFKNRMYCHVMYHSYMYATWYHTAYNDDTLSELCDEDALATRACWGPAHEIGHCNQTRPGFLWVGTTEVTNNVMSQYIQTSVFGQNSRVQTESMGDPVSKNRYSKAWNSILVPAAPHAYDGADVFCQLIPFWQLELYFGKVLDNTPMKRNDHGGFYADLYENVRTTEDPTTQGACQLEFAYRASKVSGYDLTDFFEKWGFFVPVDKKIDDYGKKTLTVTKETADAVKQRIKALGLPKPAVAMEYITDNNFQVFRNKKAVEAGLASRSGNTITMTGWKNVVVFEVREGNENGKLICVSDGILQPTDTPSFDVAGGWKNNYKVYAVSYDNKRKEVVFQ